MCGMIDDRSLAVNYMKVRKQFGSPLSNFQALQFRVADMATDLQAARLMIQNAARLLDRADPAATVHCAMAKRFATDVGFKVRTHLLCEESLWSCIHSPPLPVCFVSMV